MTGSYIEAGTLAWFPASVRQLFDAVYLTPGKISYLPENWYAPSIQILHLQQNQEKGAELGGANQVGQSVRTCLVPSLHSSTTFSVPHFLLDRWQASCQ